MANSALAADQNAASAPHDARRVSIGAPPAHGPESSDRCAVVVGDGAKARPTRPPAKAAMSGRTGTRVVLASAAAACIVFLVLHVTDEARALRAAGTGSATPVDVLAAAAAAARVPAPVAPMVPLPLGAVLLRPQAAPRRVGQRELPRVRRLAAAGKAIYALYNTTGGPESGLPALRAVRDIVTGGGSRVCAAMEAARRGVYTHNGVGWSAETTCEWVTVPARPIAGVRVPDAHCIVGFPGGIPAALWHGAWAHEGGMRRLSVAPAGSDWNLHGINGEEAQIVGIWALPHAAVTSTGLTFNLTHTMRMGRSWHAYDPRSWRCYADWFEQVATPASSNRTGTPDERRLELRHAWQLSLPPYSEPARRRDYPLGPRSCGKRRIKYVGRALLVFHYHHLSSFQHWTLDGFPRVEAALDFVRAHPHVRVMCSSPRFSARGASFCERTWTAAGVSADRILSLPGRAAGGDMYAADTVYYVQYATESLRTERLWTRAGGQGFVGSDVPAAARFQPGCAWPPPRQRNLVIFAQRTAPRMRGLPDALNRALVAGIQARLAPGLFLVVVEDSDWSRDLEMFRHARAMVGPHGGMFANMVFMPPGADIVEIGTPARTFYYHQAQAMLHRYWVVAPLALSYAEEGADNAVAPRALYNVMAAAGLLAV